MKYVKKWLRTRPTLIKVLLFLLMTIITFLVLDFLVNLNVGSSYEKSKNLQLVWIISVIACAYWWHLIFGKKKKTSKDS